MIFKAKWVCTNIEPRWAYYAKFTEIDETLWKRNPGLLQYFQSYRQT